MNAKTLNFGRRFLGRIGSVYALCAIVAAPALGQDSSGDDDQGVQVTDYGTVTLAVKDTDLAQVLEMLSIQSQKNIITSKNVSATVSANLYDVTFYEALDAILGVNGYGYKEEGNFIYIYTQDEIQEMEEAQRATDSKIFELDYLSANDANEFILPLLSDVGQSSFRGDVEPGIQPDLANNGRDDYAYNAKLIVNDYPENLANIENLLAELDTPPQQVLVEASILEIGLDESNAFGVDFSVIGDVDFTDFTNPLSGVTNLLAGANETIGFQPEDNNAQVITSSPGNVAGPGTFKVGVITSGISVFLKLLDEVTDVTVLSRPKVLCLNRQRAEILVGVQVGYLSTTATETATTEAVEFLDTGIRLNFRPFISRNGMVRLELAPSVSEARLRTVTDRDGNPRTIPDEFLNEITSNVRVKDGQTIVLGGLFKESTTSTRRQVPVIGDIPILGAAFRGHDDNVQRDEIIFMITPTVMADQALWDIGSETLSYASEVRIGARQGTLPFSRERMTSQANQEAFEAYQAGDMDQALHHINHSLRLNEHQPEMRRLREMINNEIVHPHEFSIQQRVLAQEFGRTFSPGWVTDGTVAEGHSIIEIATATAGQDAFVTAPLTAEAEQAYYEMLTQTNEVNETPSIVEANADGTINVDAEQVELAEVLELISQHSDQNILASEHVSSTISTELQGVTVNEALESILAANGCDYIEEDGFIYVFTQRELDQMAWAEAIDAGQFDGIEPNTYAISDLRKQRMVEEFIHDYFGSLGLASVAPFAETTVTQEPIKTAAVPTRTTTEFSPFVEGQVEPIVATEILPDTSRNRPATTWSEPEVQTAATSDAYSPFMPFQEGAEDVTDEPVEILPSLADADNEASPFE